MGEHKVSQESDERKMRAFMKAVLDDLRAMESMLQSNQIEDGVHRIGAEQEMFLIDSNMQPAPIVLDVMKKANDPRLTTEIAKFNLEANLTPLFLGGRCLKQMEDEIEEVLALVRNTAQSFGARVLLAGILPTLRKPDLSLDNLTPLPRYFELNRAISFLRGGSVSIHIKGLDELHLVHDNVMMEGCNTSFQIHLQVGPREFVPLYNLSQAITGPVLAGAVNSPLLLGHRLWQETRLALFQHSADLRSSSEQARSHPTRVGFGNAWLQESVLEVFREDIARFRVILTTEADEDPLAVLARGGIPELSALRLHNGTIWRWNRPCYGITDGRPHLRIENRALPSGPTVRDEMANAAFYIGLMSALPDEYGDIEKLISFDDAKTNFFAAARYGLHAQIEWVKGKSYPAAELILKHLLPLASQGLKQAGIEIEDSDTYLGIFEERVRSGQTGSQWTLQSLAAMGEEGTLDMRQHRLTSAMLDRQQTGDPVHRWPLIEANEVEDWSRNYQTVAQFMSTDLFTVRPDDLVDLAASVMDWKHVRHVPVEDGEGHLVGLVSHRNLLRLLACGLHANNAEPIAVRNIMKVDPVTVSPDTPTLEAIEIMRNHKLGCLPVVEDGTLVGILTAHDFLEVSRKLFQERMAMQPNEKSQAATRF